MPLHEMQNPAYVLYVDHQGHPAPLTEQFHATASRRLSSAVFRYPVSTTTEVDSAYCPQCLSFYDAARGAELGYCPKQTTCQRCPLCLSVASVQASAAPAESDAGMSLDCFYQCGSCDWTSRRCGLVVPLETTASPGRVELLRAAEELVQALNERRSQDPAGAWHQKLVQDYEEATRASQLQLQPTARRADEWSVATLDAQRRAVETQWNADHSNYELSSAFKRTSIQDILDPPTSVDELTWDDPRTLLAYQMQPQTLDTAMMLPLPVALETRESRRCRAELAEGRPGILLKPKLNPQEGDSSLATGHGQWHRKDSSAIHVIPRIQVIQHDPPRPENSNRRVFLLKVSNPTLGTVRLRLPKSNYCGEIDHWDEFSTSSEPKPTATLSGVLVDSLQQTFMDVRLSNLESSGTDTVELLSAEDSIIELGASANDTPTEVSQWSSSTIPPETPSASAMMMIRLVGKSASDAWYELVLPSSWEDASNAVPLAVEVDLGNGSWESSLIPTQPDVKDDKATFDLVLVWTK